MHTPSDFQPKNGRLTKFDGTSRKKRPVSAGFQLLVMMVSFVGCASLAEGPVTSGSSALTETLEIIRTIPHTGYSEGLDFHEGFLWHALPKEIVKIDPKDGSIVARYLPGSEYSESIVWFGGAIWNVSYSDDKIYRGTLKGNELKWEQKGKVPDVHAWGMETDGKSIIITGNYSNKIIFLDPKTFATRKTLSLPVSDLEDLAWDGKHFYTSSFTTNRGQIFQVDPNTGEILGYFLLPKANDCPVVDGIAFDGKALWITGKNCPSIYQSKVPNVREVSSKR